jgi:hypothetical protein
LDSFEQGILKCLREVTPRDVLPPENGHVDRGLELAAELAGVEASIAALVADLDAHGDSPTLMARVRAKETRQAELRRLLAEAGREASSPLGEVWGEFKSLAEVLETAPDREEARIRTRSALRRLLERVYCVFTGKGKVRLAFVQVLFTSGKAREYIIYHRAALGCRGTPTKPAVWAVTSWPEGAGESAIDLRRPGQVRMVRDMLASPFNMVADILAACATPEGGRPSAAQQEAGLYEMLIILAGKLKIEIPTTDLPPTGPAK